MDVLFDDYYGKTKPDIKIEDLFNIHGYTIKITEIDGTWYKYCIIASKNPGMCVGRNSGFGKDSLYSLELRIAEPRKKIIG